MIHRRWVCVICGRCVDTDCRSGEKHARDPSAAAVHVVCSLWQSPLALPCPWCSTKDPSAAAVVAGVSPAAVTRRCCAPQRAIAFVSSTASACKRLPLPRLAPICSLLRP